MTQIYKLTVHVQVPRAGVVLNVQHFDAPDPSGSDDIPWEVANDMVTSWLLVNKTNYLALLGNDVSLAAVSAQRIYPTGGPTATKVVNTMGASDSAMGNSATCVNCELITDVSPYVPGHQYIGGNYAGALNDNFWDITFLGFVTDYLISLVLPLVGTLPGLPTYHIGIWNRKTHVLEKVKHTQIAPKPTALNKRFGPYL